MQRLHLHTDKASGGTHGAAGVFYSQRAGGPHYRWRLDENGLGGWRFTRLRPAEWNPKVLFNLNQKDMPAALLTRLAEHYMR